MSIEWDNLLDTNLDTVIDEFQYNNKIELAKENNTIYVPSDANINTPKIIETYSVMWGTRSNRKHKIWKGDGIMHATKNKLEIRDGENNIIATTSDKSKCKIEFIEGVTFSIGIKEILLVTKLN